MRYRTQHLSLLILMGLGAVCAGVARGQVTTEFMVPTTVSGPFGIASGPDEALWFTEHAAGQIGRITTAGIFTEFTIPTVGSNPVGIAVGPDGNLWFTEESSNKIGRITTTGVFTEFPTPTLGSNPIGIVAGSDGNLWFTEGTGNKIGRITPAGVFTEFAIPTVGSNLVEIAAGPDGNLWFTENFTNKIGRITTVGVITEFTIPTTDSFSQGIAAGPDGKLWFTELGANKIGRITTAGVFTEFTIPTASSFAVRIASGPDGNVWFTEELGNKIGRITPAGVFTEFTIPAADSSPEGIVAGSDGALWFSEYSGNQIGRITVGPATAQAMAVDARDITGSSSNANGVLEPGETVQVAPAWRNTLTSPETFTGTATTLTGPAGPSYTINDSSADYGTVGPDATRDCNTATADCYLMTVSGTRPTQHWDANFTEGLNVGSITKIWKLHVGNSFPDVPTSDPFYAFIENLFHNGITGGCTGGGYCPSNSVTRAQMAVFLMKSKLGAAEIPPPATGTVFSDVPASNPFAPFIEQLAGFAISGGCGGGNYCPTNPVTRAQMAVFLLKAEHGSAYAPPACTGIFTDVECSPTPAFAVDWIEQLFHEGVTGGCGGGMYCPGNPVSRGQMAVFLVKTFALQLYGP